MTQQFPFADMFKNWESAVKDATSKMPKADFSAASSFFKKQAEANAAITKLMAESIQDVAKKSTESAQKNFEKSVNLFKEVAAAKDPRDSAAKQAEFSKELMANLATEAQDLAQLASKSSAKVYELASKQMNDSIKQFGGAAKATKVATKAA